MAVLGDTIINGALRVNGKISSNSGSGGDFNIDKVYPIGAIYMSVVSTDPGTLFGGTWERWGSGRVPVGIDTSDSDFSTVEKTGGSKTCSVLTTNLPAHTHTYNKPNGATGNKTLGVEHIPAHTHGNKSLTGTFAVNPETTIVRATNNSYHFFDSSGIVSFQNTGTNGTVYEKIGGGGNLKTLWRDKVYINASHEHNSVGGGQGHNHSISTTSTNTGSAGSSTPINIQQKYITCYMWKRTA